MLSYVSTFLSVLWYFFTWAFRNAPVSNFLSFSLVSICLEPSHHYGIFRLNVKHLRSDSIQIISQHVDLFIVFVLLALLLMFQIDASSWTDFPVSQGDKGDNILQHSQSQPLKRNLCSIRGVWCSIAWATVGVSLEACESLRLASSLHVALER